MGNVTLGEICDAIEATLGAATGIQTTQSYDELKESLNKADLPLLQVYWESFDMDPSGDTDATTFQGVVRQKRIVYHADLLAATRGPGLGQEMAKAVDIADAILDVFEEQDTSFFGLDGIKSWSVSAIRGKFPYAAIDYLGVQFVITVHVY